MYLIAPFGRFLGFSFSGCQFVKQHGDYQIDQKKFVLQDWRYSVKQASKRYLGVCLNCLVLLIYIAPFLNIERNSESKHLYGNNTSFADATSKEHRLRDVTSKSNYISIHIEDFEHFIRSVVGQMTNTEEDLSQLKPILRIIMRWLVYVFLLNGFLSYFYNLLFGGSLVRHLIGIREFGELDQGKSLSRWLLGIAIAVVLATKFFSVYMYQWNLLSLLISSDIGNYYPGFQKIRRPYMLLTFTVELFFAFVHFMSLSFISIFFIYGKFFYLRKRQIEIFFVFSSAMIMFRRSIEQMQNKIVNSKEELDELQLSLLKTRLYRLNEAFKMALHFFSVPITFDLLANTYMLIGYIFNFAKFLF